PALAEPSLELRRCLALAGLIGGLLGEEIRAPVHAAPRALLFDPTARPLLDLVELRADLGVGRDRRFRGAELRAQVLEARAQVADESPVLGRVGARSRHGAGGLDRLPQSIALGAELGDLGGEWLRVDVPRHDRGHTRAALALDLGERVAVAVREP